MKKNQALKLILSLIGGLLYAASFPMKWSPPLPVGAIIGFSLLFKNIVFENQRSLKLRLTHTLCFSFGFYALGFYWIPETIQVFGGIPETLSIVVGALFALIILPHLTLFSIIYPKINNRLGPYGSEFSFFITAIFLTLIEYYTPQQFPAHIGHSFLFLSPYLKPAQYFGAPLYSFFSFLIALCIACAPLKLFKFKISKTAFLLFIASHFLVGKIDLQRESTHTEQVRMVQANIGSLMKVSSERGKSYDFKEVINTYKRLSLMPSKEPLDIIIWPETAYPGLLTAQAMKANPRFIPSLFRSIIKQKSASLFFGGYDYKENINSDLVDFETQYNTAFYLSQEAQLTQLYHKMKLIPFGETLPLGPLTESAARVLQNVSYFAAGTEFKIFKSQKGSLFTSAICYEILFSSFIRKQLNNLKENPQFMINLTNDSWYGDTSEPYQHLFLSKWRAVEYDIPIIRMTNTGISSFLYQDGSESERLGLNKRGVLDLPLSISKREKTFFQRFGFLSMLLIWVPMGLLIKRKSFFPKVMNT